jgi:hypothetical protein
MSRSPFTTAELRSIPRKAFAYSANNGATWEIVSPAETPEQVVATGNNQPLRPSDYYLAPVDSVVIARRSDIATQAERAYESGSYWA